MSNNDDFYIGYLDKQHISRRVIAAVVVLVIVAPILALWLTSQQRGFANSTYEFGTLTEVSGTVVLEPVPMLITEDRSILLVGFGKFGADELFDDAQQTPAAARIEGTLIYYDGKTALEITKGSEAIRWLEEREAHPPKAVHDLGERSIEGEIIDPKCYFGAMKPGQGKPHRACAINCISGGIPPMVAVREQGAISYFLLRGPDGEAVNEDILDLVALPCVFRGTVVEYGDWSVLRCDPASIKRR